MDTYAADVAELVQALDLKNAIHIGHSTGGGEVTRYVARHGKGRVTKAVLISAIPPLFIQSDKNPDGVPKEIVDMYCEDSVANQVEHIRPKALYPEELFVWLNYLYDACGPCNSPKQDNFAVYAATRGRHTDVTRRRNATVAPPTPGTPVLINPRQEDPLDFMMLDLTGTFFFMSLCNYRLCDSATRHELERKAERSARLSAQPLFLLREVFQHLTSQRLLAPPYTVLQDLVGRIVTQERNRLTGLLEQALTLDLRKKEKTCARSLGYSSRKSVAESGGAVTTEDIQALAAGKS